MLSIVGWIGNIGLLLTVIYISILMIPIYNMLKNKEEDSIKKARLGVHVSTGVTLFITFALLSEYAFFKASEIPIKIRVTLLLLGLLGIAIGGWGIYINYKRLANNRKHGRVGG